ncbi:MAG: hypothetical protein R6V86_09090 [Spirochaetia bacterium]
MRNKRRRVKNYSLGYLLSKQPKSLQKNQFYEEMLLHYRSSTRLQKLRISRRCYNLLQQAVIKPEYLDNFYRTYRLPRDPFFPLFLRVKRDYLEQRRQRQEQKMRYIADKMRGLPPDTLAFIKYLAAFEQRYNRADNFPVWTAHLFPTTKKRVNEYGSFTRTEWITLFSAHLQRLEQRYRELDEDTSQRILASYVLECLPREGKTPGLEPDLQAAARNYRRLSKLYHPDLGGEGDFFLQLQWAKEVLSGR